MRTILILVGGLLMTCLPVQAQTFEVGPGGVHVFRHGGGDCRELRAACMHKDEMGENGMGNCQRYRELCSGGARGFDHPHFRYGY